MVIARVGELRAALPAAQRGRITMAVAVAEDSIGVRNVLVATSEPRGYLRPGAALRQGETVVGGTAHAEANIIAHAVANNLAGDRNWGNKASLCPLPGLNQAHRG